MIKLNLLPDIKREYLRTRRLEAKVISGAIVAMLAALGLVVFAALAVYGAQALQISLLSGSIKDNAQKLASIKDIEKYVTVQNQLTQINQLHEKKNIYSRVFDVAARVNPKAPNNVRITALDVDAATTTMRFQGETASFTGLETFRDTLKNAGVVFSEGNDTANAGKEPLFTPSSVTVVTQALGKSQTGQQVVSFEVTAAYNARLFSRQVKSYIISVPSIETTQTKQDAPNVFGEPTINQEGQ